MKTDFIWTESHSRELSRIDRYLRFGTEMNAIDCDKNSSFNAFIKAEDESKRIPHNKSLKSVTNLWNSVKDFDINAQKMVASKIETTITSVTEPFHENAICFVIISLFECQKSGDQSPFRSLAISLILKPFVRPINILVLCKAIGNKRINNSSRIRDTLAKYYSQQFNDEQLEEILVFSSKFGWSHSDVIRLCHVKENSLTKILMRRKGDNNELSEVEQRVRILRSLTSKPNEVLSALDKTTLEPKLWLRALNTVWRKNASVWIKIVENANEDKVLSLVPRILSKFPNHKALYEAIYLRLKQKESFTSNLIKNFVLFYIERNFLKINNSLMQQLCNAIKTIDIPKRISSPIRVVFDPNLDFDEKYLSGLANKKREKDDLLDQMYVKDFLELLVQSFNCYVSRNETMVQLKSISEAKGSDSLEFPSYSSDEKWNERVIYVSQSQQDIKLWSEKADEKLIVFHPKKIQLKNLSYYRENVLIFNGFDMKLESIIATFFDQSIEKMDTN